MSSRPYRFREPEEKCSNCKVLQLVKNQLEQESAKGQDYREKLRDARAELNSKDRQLEVARRMLAKVNAEKSNLEINVDNDRAAFRKLEARLALNKEGPELQAKLAKYKSRVIELKQGLEDAEARLQLAEEANLVQSREVHVLKGALGLRNDGTNCTLDNQAQLLHTIAQSQEESASLALALAAKERMVSELSLALRDSKAEVDRMLGARLDMEARIEELKRNAQQAMAEAEEHQREAEGARAQAKSACTGEEEALAYRARTEALLRNAESGMAALKDRNRALSEKMQGMERSSRLSAEALRTEVAFAVERAEAATAQARADAAMGEAVLQERLVQCQQDLEQAKADAVEAARIRGADASSSAAREAALRDEVQALKQAGRRHMDEAERLAEHVDKLAEANRKLKVDLDIAQQAAADTGAHSRELAGALDAERAAQTDLSQHVSAMEARLRESLRAGSAREAALQEQVHALRSELLACSNMVDRLQAELQLTRTQGTQAASKYAHVDEHVEDLHATIQQLTQSKARMQSSMLEQITSFRSQLEVAAEENKQLRHELTQLNHAAVSRVQERSEALLQQQHKAIEHDDPCGPVCGSRQAPGLHDMPILHTISSPPRQRPHTTTTMTASHHKGREDGIWERAQDSIPGRQGPPPTFRRRAAITKKENDCSSSEDDNDVGAGGSRRDAGMRKSTLLDRARAASRARGYEDSDDDSDTDIKKRGSIGLHAGAGCSCPHCKSGKGRSGACVQAKKGGFGSSALRRTLI